MRGTIKIGERSIDMVANGATPYIYKKVFRRDFLAATQKDEMNFDLYAELAYIMAMQAERPLAELVNGLSIDGFYEWIAGFEAMDMVKHATEVFALYEGQAGGTSVAKKKK